VLYTDEETAVEDVYRLGFRALGLGLVGIAVVFLLGLLLFDLNISRRVLRIAAVARRIARGDLAARVSPPPDPEKRFGLDEIDELSVGFNNMVDSVEQSHRRITAANELKKKFIQVAAHELRTPTTFMVGISRMLRNCDDATRLREALKSIGAKADRLNHIVQSMFQLLPGGKLSRKLHYTDVSTAELLEELLRSVAPFLEGREVTIALDPGDVTQIRVDRATVLDVLENLVTNAIRFTPDGGTVQVRIERLPDDRVAFHVADQGPGIPDSELPYLFEPFYSGGGAMHHSSGTGFRKRGIGLGLAVVKYLVELHDGTVEVASSPQGSTLTVRIPIRPTERTNDRGEDEGTEP
jgi:signal transduction histidine kinase